MSLSKFVKPDNTNEILFNFAHKYFKLEKAEQFTTIRSVHYNRKQRHKFEIGAVGWITLKRKAFKKVRVLKYVDKRIYDMPLKLLQKDANYPGHYITCRQDFLDVLNEFAIRKCGFGNNKLTTTKRIFYLENYPRTEDRC